MHEAIVELDAALLRGVFALPHPDWLNAIAGAASFAGIGGAVWVALSGLLLLFRDIRWTDAVRLVAAIALVHLVVDVGLKPWIDRQRPPVTLTELAVVVEVPESRSFPSGHAANAAAAAVVLTRVWRRRALWPLLWAGAFVVGVARVYLGIHYPLDALAGTAVGLFCGWAVLRAGGCLRLRLQ